MMEKIVVLLSSYNGEKYIKQQIDSILSQTDVHPYLIIRDDGSTDETIKILEEYQKLPNVTVLLSNNVGCKKSFYYLCQYAIQYYPNIEYYAFADQDDYWKPEKLIRGISFLSKQLNKTFPCLYFCPPTIVDKDLKSMGKRWDTNHLLTFEEACIAQPCAGCCMVFNQRALQLFLLAKPEKMSMHDSWMYKTVLACNGQVFEDKESYILYRQHGNNVIGTQNFFSRWKRRYKNFIHGSKYRSEQVEELLNIYADYMSSSIHENAELLSTYTGDIRTKFKIFTSKSFITTNKINNLLFRIAIFFNRF